MAGCEGIAAGAGARAHALSGACVGVTAAGFTARAIRGVGGSRGGRFAVCRASRGLQTCWTWGTSLHAGEPCKSFRAAHQGVFQSVGDMLDRRPHPFQLGQPGRTESRGAKFVGWVRKIV